MRRKVLIIGATGTIGSAISAEIEGDYEIIQASRSCDEAVDISDHASVEQLFNRIKSTHSQVDGIIVVAGGGMVSKIDDMDLDAFLPTLAAKLRGQVAVVKYGRRIVRSGGAIILTGGTLANTPMHDMSHLSIINAAIHAFVRSAELESESVRICAVSPALVAESPEAILELFEGMPKVNAAKVATTYRYTLEHGKSGTTYDACDATELELQR